MPKKPEAFTTTKAAAALGCSRRHVLTLLRKPGGPFPNAFMKADEHGQLSWFIPEADIIAEKKAYQAKREDGKLRGWRRGQPRS